MRYFSKDERSTFPYWFAHWCAFQIIALLTGLWKPKYLFHDFEKPWLKLFWPYEKVRKWHRLHSNHHLEWLVKHGPEKFDFEGMLIDWECGRLTKRNSPLRAINYFKKETDKLQEMLGPDYESSPTYQVFVERVRELLKRNFD